MSNWNDAGKAELPKSVGDYLKFEQGENKFRILSEPVMGWEYWTEDKKPIRSKNVWNVIPLNADISKGWNPKYFWAFVVWNFKAKRIQILEITQKSILSPLQSLVQNEDWGDPREYSITITRKGEGMETEYGVVPSPSKPVPEDITKQFKEKNVDLEQLFSGGNPFDAAAKKEIVEDMPDELLQDNLEEPSF